jgi:hypothetical protein
MKKKHASIRILVLASKPKNGDHIVVHSCIPLSDNMTKASFQGLLQSTSQFYPWEIPRKKTIQVRIQFIQQNKNHIGVEIIDELFIFLE